jgi:hypothetical protein
MSRRSWLILILFALVALFLILLVFGLPILFYFGIFSPRSTMPHPPPFTNNMTSATPTGSGTKPVGTHNEVIGMTVFYMMDYSLFANGEVMMHIENAAAAPVNITEIKINGTPVTMSGGSPTFPTVMDSGEDLIITGETSMRGNKGTSFTEIKIEINYSLVGGGRHLDSGIMQGYFE